MLKQEECKIKRQIGKNSQKLKVTQLIGMGELRQGSALSHEPCRTMFDQLKCIENNYDQNNLNLMWCYTDL